MYRIDIDTDGPAFADVNLGREAARILRRLADDLEHNAFQSRRKLTDRDGNVVGMLTICDEKGVEL